jgi:hypothetical protein
MDREPEILPEKATQIFRILQEALTNVVRHAQAKTIEVDTAVRNDEFTLAIRDDGTGIDEEKITDYRSIGLTNMRERARLIGGRLDISPSDDHGTLVRFAVPLQGIALPHLDQCEIRRLFKNWMVGWPNSSVWLIAVKPFGKSLLASWDPNHASNEAELPYWRTEKDNRQPIRILAWNHFRVRHFNVVLPDLSGAAQRPLASNRTAPAELMRASEYGISKFHSRCLRLLESRCDLVPWKRILAHQW